MKNVSILVPETAVIEAVADPHYMFKAVNLFLQASGKPALFNVQLVAINKEVKLENSLFTVHTGNRYWKQKNKFNSRSIHYSKNQHPEKLSPHQALPFSALR